MIDKVIIYDIKCGKKYISALEARQIMGRAGRTYNQFEQGEAFIFGQEQDSDIIDEYLYGNDNKISSNLNDIDKISFHILPYINDSIIKSISDIKEWFSKSLSYIQGNEVDENEIYQYLIDNKCMDEKFNILFNGKLSIQYYYTPNRIYTLENKLNFIHQIGDNSLMSYAWLCSYYSGYPIKHPAYFEFKDNFTNKFYLDHNEEFDVFVYYLIFNNRIVKKIGSYINGTKKDLHRLLRVLHLISKHNQIDITNDLKILENILYYGVNKAVANVMQKTGVYDKKSAEMLYNLSILSKEEIFDKIEYIKEYADKRTANMCLEIINGENNNVESN